MIRLLDACFCSILILVYFLAVVLPQVIWGAFCGMTRAVLSAHQKGELRILESSRMKARAKKRRVEWSPHMNSET